MIQDKEYVVCNLCRADDAEPVFNIGSFNVIQCKECGLYYINPRLVKEKMKEVYSEEFYVERGKSYVQRAMPENIKEIIRKKPLKRRLSYIIRYKKTGKILDVGCGKGEFLNVAKENGWEPYGVEISEFASNFAESNFGLPIFTGTLTEAAFKDKFFDVVTMFDVFSHLPDPLGDFIEAHRTLKDEGIFVFMTGNYSLLPDSLFKERWGRPEEHYWKLNSQSLKALLAKSGFQLIKSKVIGSLIPISPRKLSQIGVPTKALSFLMRIPLPTLSDEVMFICKKHNR